MSCSRSRWSLRVPVRSRRSRCPAGGQPAGRPGPGLPGAHRHVQDTAARAARRGGGPAPAGRAGGAPAGGPGCPSPPPAEIHGGRDPGRHRGRAEVDQGVGDRRQQRRRHPGRPQRRPAHRPEPQQQGSAARCIRQDERGLRQYAHRRCAGDQQEGRDVHGAARPAAERVADGADAPHPRRQTAQRRSARLPRAASINDLTADSRGRRYVTMGGVFHADAKGTVRAAAKASRPTV